MRNQRLFILLFTTVAILFIGLHIAKIGKIWGRAFVGGSQGFSRSDQPGEPVGADFTLYYAASAMALSGPPEEVYNFPHLRETEQRLFGPSVALPWPYPPTFLLLVLPLALLPYLVSLSVWLFTTLAAYLLVVRRAAPHPLTIWLTLGFPGTFVNFICGQNGFLSASLFGGGLLLMERFPRTGGVLLGFMSYKPHLAVLIPIALLAGKRWQTLLWAGLTALGLAVISAVIFGPKIWSSFFNHILYSVNLLEDSSAPWEKMPSVYAAIQQMGGSFWLSWLGQGLTMAGVMVAVAWLWFRKAPSSLANAALVLGALLFPPHAFNYDLVLLALPLAWLGWEGYVRGWRPFEPCVLMLGWAMPLFLIPTKAKLVDFPLGPLILVSLLLVVIWRQCRLDG